MHKCFEYWSRSLFAEPVCVRNSEEKFELQLNLSTTATLRTEESGRCGAVAVMGRLGCNMTNYF